MDWRATTRTIKKKPIVRPRTHPLNTTLVQQQRINCKYLAYFMWCTRTVFFFLQSETSPEIQCKSDANGKRMLQRLLYYVVVVAVAVSKHPFRMHFYRFSPGLRFVLHLVRVSMLMLSVFLLLFFARLDFRFVRSLLLRHHYTIHHCQIEIFWM